MSFLGCISLYLCHSNQTLLKQHLATWMRYIGAFILIFALLILLYALPKHVAVFVWMAIITVMWCLLPFIALFKRYTPHEIKK
ncbi:hypothetical protein [Acinetobacter puyangensis]|uniref:hypothetical protein n=1 Tax=Acinetobacter puyangensis TaxID=1096779 RepID=UPI001142E499|nr:hypothetical protein [Acinetobacter puyangensis]